MSFSALKKIYEDMAHHYNWYQRVQGMLVGAYACMVLVVLESCQGCNKAAVAPDLSETVSDPVSDPVSEPVSGTVAPDLGGIPNVGNTCYVNSVLQIIAKLYPSAFDGKNDPLATAGQAIVKKISDDQGYVTKEEADAFYTALLGKTSFARGMQEDAQELLMQLLDLYEIDPHKSSQSIHTRVTDPTGRTQYSRQNEGPQRDISLPHEDCTMRECLEKEFGGDVSLTGDSQYNRNGTKVDAIRQYRLKIDNDKSKFPLSFFLKRADNSMKKRRTCILDPFQLTIPAAIQYEGKEDLKYTLTAFVSHIGSSAHSGHYVAYIQQNKQWKLYDDARVWNVPPAEAEEAAKQAYLCFYEPTTF